MPRPGLGGKLPVHLFLLRNCHGDAMFQVPSKPTVACRFRACPGAHKKLDGGVPGFRQRLRNLWAIGAGNAQSRDQNSGSPTGGTMFGCRVSRTSEVSSPTPSLSDASKDCAGSAEPSPPV